MAVTVALLAWSTAARADESAVLQLGVASGHSDAAISSGFQGLQRSAAAGPLVEIVQGGHLLYRLMLPLIDKYGANFEFLDFRHAEQGDGDDSVSRQIERVSPN